LSAYFYRTHEHHLVCGASLRPVSGETCYIPQQLECHRNRQVDQTEQLFWINPWHIARQQHFLLIDTNAETELVVTKLLILWPTAIELRMSFKTHFVALVAVSASNVMGYVSALSLMLLALMSVIDA
jgi:hypothetical protein